MLEKELKRAGNVDVQLLGSSAEGVFGDEGPKLTGFAAFKDSFRRQEPSALDIDPNLSDAEKIAIMTANSPLSRSLKSRHLQMISIGGTIGTGLFVGSGSALRTGGPGGVLIAWLIVGGMIYAMIQAVGELAVTFPVSGAYCTYSIRFIDESWGFAVAWNYLFGYFNGLALELIAASITIKYWNSEINTVGFIAIFYVLIVSINFFGVRGYGEAEFVFSLIKVMTIIGFIILGIVLICGGGPIGGYIGAKYWYHPGAFANGFKGVCSVFVTAGFSFGLTEMAGLAAAETANPRQAIPKAIKQVFWRIVLFYIISLTLIGCLIPYTDKHLFASSSVDASASPFVIAIVNGGIKGLPSVMNVVIIVAVLSVGNTCVFASSRVLAALSAAGLAPKIFLYIDKRGRPIAGIILQSIVGLLCFLAASPKQGEVFTWLMAIGGISGFVNWGSICLGHIRFRYALKKKGRDTSELAYVSQCGVWGSYYGLLICVLILAAQFWIALFPLGKKPNASGFFAAYLAMPVILGFYVAHKIWSKNWKLYIRWEDMDIDTGRRDLDLDLLKQELASEKAALAAKPWYYRVYRFWC
ncbi:hypothetical protein BABINDRAFT_6992 [Babjeviella inositovora NRRL Y-12698]|uniref:Amino acid permease/ SLC12A domain-containing protein n=1 Tax=Babjeviella inositovora NRRL Y-12698 TaxID=984486 RepID=A0A1E3QUD2_9ASCO|nr:uncharacterized protein BABINDRAFT_6992 [Babjeviella inositovora NRRL Y-12698]ODQ81164.1 hypothetical protein BABINDRAFT_6992 [Babjeviella inositovora NRRL Y-12698]